jgi:hypothetical protein
MFRALNIGVLVLLIADAMWFAFLISVGEMTRPSGATRVFYAASFLVQWGAPLVAAFLAAHLAPERRMVAGMSMVLPATLLTVAMNSLYQSLGHHVDFPGLQGAVIATILSLIWNTILCVLGTVAGYLLARQR